MKPAGRLCVIVALAIAMFAVLGCGGTVIDTAKTEDLLQNEAKVLLSERPDGEQTAKALKIAPEEKPSSVDCPSDQEVDPGATFACTMAFDNGAEARIIVKIINEDADLSVKKVEPAESAD
jgi:hypothetical protein